VSSYCCILSYSLLFCGRFDTVTIHYDIPSHHGNHGEEVYHCGTSTGAHETFLSQGKNEKKKILWINTSSPCGRCATVTTYMWPQRVTTHVSSYYCLCVLILLQLTYCTCKYEYQGQAGEGLTCNLHPLLTCVWDFRFICMYPHTAIYWHTVSCCAVSVLQVCVPSSYSSASMHICPRTAVRHTIYIPSVLLYICILTYTLLPAQKTVLILLYTDIPSPVVRPNATNPPLQTLHELPLPSPVSHPACCCQYTSAYVNIHASAYVSIRQHTSAYVSIRQHTSAYVSIRQHMSAYVNIRQDTSGYVRIRQDTSACVSIRQHTSVYVSKSPLDEMRWDEIRIDYIEEDSPLLRL
jgi:hypothetical protein